jgi:ABC-type dipeptide/oligopeptide/nickel transport system ATPase component
MVFQSHEFTAHPVFTVSKQMKEILDEHQFMGNVSNAIGSRGQVFFIVTL